MILTQMVLFMFRPRIWAPATNRKITITASSNLSDDEIDKAVKEAERFAAEDKKRKEEIETRNEADSMVYQTEKTLKDLGDKLNLRIRTRSRQR